MDQPPQKTSGLAVTSLILGALGVLGFFCGGVLLGIPAIITGLIARGKIRSSGEKGGGMAVAGVALGSLSIVVTIVAAIFVTPVFMKAGAAAKIAMREQRLQAAIRKSGLWPADAGIASASALGEALIEKGAATREEVDGFGIEDFLVGNVSAEDPGDTILICTKPGSLMQGMVSVFYKDGSNAVFPSEGEMRGNPPPREPQYLAE